MGHPLLHFPLSSHPNVDDVADRDPEDLPSVPDGGHQGNPRADGGHPAKIVSFMAYPGHDYYIESLCNRQSGKQKRTEMDRVGTD